MRRFLALTLEKTGYRVTLLTSRSDDKHRQLAMSLDATAYFSKPYNEHELLQTLGRAIEERVRV